MKILCLIIFTALCSHAEMSSKESAEVDMAALAAAKAATGAGFKTRSAVNDQAIDRCLIAINEVNVGSLRESNAKNLLKISHQNKPYTWDGTRIQSLRNLNILWSKNMGIVDPQFPRADLIEIKKKIIQAHFEKANLVQINNATRPDLAEKLLIGYGSCQKVDALTADGENISTAPVNKLMKLKKIFPPPSRQSGSVRSAQ